MAHFLQQGHTYFKKVIVSNSATLGGISFQTATVINAGGITELVTEPSATVNNS